MATVRRTDFVALTQSLLDSIQNQDWEAYSALCDPSLTAFEPEARGVLVHGLDFHKFYFDQKGKATPKHSTMASPHVRAVGTTVVIVSYIRLIQRPGEGGRFETDRFEETRVWQRTKEGWKHVHFHRSLVP